MNDRERKAIKLLEPFEYQLSKCFDDTSSACQRLYDSAYAAVLKALKEGGK